MINAFGRAWPASRALAGLALLLMLAALAGCAGPAPAPPGVAVDKVNLVLLQGHWYEVASTQPFDQRGCVCTQSQYLLHGKELVMETTCRPWAADRPALNSTGLATPLPGSGDAQLDVVFHWPAHQGYWIIGLDQEYRWLVLGSADRQEAWILARSPRLAPEVYQSLLELARQKGYPADRLVPTPQDCP